MYYRVDFKLCMLWTLLVLQVLLVIYYLLMAPSSYTLDYSTSTPKEHEFSFSSSSKSYPIKFVASDGIKAVPHRKEWQGYLTEADRTVLPDIVASSYFIKLNNETECFEQGTDIGYTKRRHVSIISYLLPRNFFSCFYSVAEFRLGYVRQVSYE